MSGSGAPPGRLPIVFPEALDCAVFAAGPVSRRFTATAYVVVAVPLLAGWVLYVHIPLGCI